MRLTTRFARSGHILLSHRKQLLMVKINVRSNKIYNLVYYFKALIFITQLSYKGINPEQLINYKYLFLGVYQGF